MIEAFKNRSDIEHNVKGNVCAMNDLVDLKKISPFIRNEQNVRNTRVRKYYG